MYGEDETSKYFVKYFIICAVLKKTYSEAQLLSISFENCLSEKYFEFFAF